MSQKTLTTTVIIMNSLWSLGSDIISYHMKSIILFVFWHLSLLLCYVKEQESCSANRLPGPASSCSLPIQRVPATRRQSSAYLVFSSSAQWVCTHERLVLWLRGCVQDERVLPWALALMQNCECTVEKHNFGLTSACESS